MRFDYTIEVPDGDHSTRLDGLCRVKVSDEVHQMTGKYFKLRPIDPTSELTEWGTIILQRLEKGATLEMPSYDHLGFEEKRAR